MLNNYVNIFLWSLPILWREKEDKGLHLHAGTSVIGVWEGCKLVKIPLIRVFVAVAPVLVVITLVALILVPGISKVLLPDKYLLQ